MRVLTFRALSRPNSIALLCSDPLIHPLIQLVPPYVTVSPTLCQC